MVKIKGSVELIAQGWDFRQALIHTGVTIAITAVFFMFFVIPVILGELVGKGYAILIDLLSGHGFELPVITLDQLYTAFGIFVITFIGLAMGILWLYVKDWKLAVLSILAGFSCAYAILYMIVPIFVDLLNLIVQPIPIFDDLGWILDLIANDIRYVTYFFLVLVIVFWLFSSLWLWQLTKRYQITSPIVLGDTRKKMKNRKKK